MQRRVDLRTLKAAVGVLPGESVVRSLIEAEPDELEEGLFVARSEVWVHAIFAEAEAARVAELIRRPLPGVERKIRALTRRVAG